MSLIPTLTLKDLRMLRLFSLTHAARCAGLCVFSAVDAWVFLHCLSSAALANG